MYPIVYQVRRNNTKKQNQQAQNTILFPSTSCTHFLEFLGQNLHPRGRVR